MNKIIEYFDLVSQYRSTGARALSESGKRLHWIPQYIALFLGILLQPFFDHFRQTNEWSFDALSGWAFFALIVATMIFPSEKRPLISVIY